MSPRGGPRLSTTGQTPGEGVPPQTGPGHPDLHDDAERQRVEAAIEALPGIVAVRVVPGFDRVVDELHVVARPDKDPRQVVRDLQSFLYATFGISTDHRVVSVVLIDTDERLLGGPRVAIDRVTVVHEQLEVAVVVDVVIDGVHREGQEVGAASASGRRRAVARATLGAVRELLGEGQRAEHEGTTVESLLGYDLAVTIVHLRTTDGQRTLAGTALVHDDESMAVARSVLDALNRSLTT